MKEPPAKAKKTEKKSGRPLQGEQPRVMISARISAEHAELLRALVVKDRRPRSTLIEMALERLGTEHGLWPRGAGEE